MLKLVSKVFVLILCSTCIIATAQPANPNASQQARDVLGYLAHLSSEPFHSVIAGQNCGHGTEIHEKYPQYVETIYDSTGKWLGLIGLDYEFIREYTVNELYNVNQVLIDHWKRGGLITSDAVLTADEIDWHGYSEVADRQLPKSHTLLKAYPNPFNSGTTLSFNLDSPHYIEMSIFDLTGRKIETLRQEYLPAGDHQFVWSAEQWPSGLYWAVLRTSQASFETKLMHIR